VSHSINHWVLLFLTLVCSSVNAQEQDSVVNFTDVQNSVGFIDYAAEYYIVDSQNSFLENHFLVQPFISNKHILNVEGGIVSSFKDSQSTTTIGDVSFSYQRNFQSVNYGETGYQGFALKAKLIFPTGQAEYFSGFDSWTIEPLFGTQWLFNIPDWFTSIQVRYNYSFASLPDKSKRPGFLRLEYFFGYESEHMWLFIQPDYRYIPESSKSTLFLTLDGAYKINNGFGVRAKISPRVMGTDFFEVLSVLGVYMNL
jgi:hypothetical protein